jgi:peptidoglycan/LPS O-acetylase OafA/YrhL
MMFKGKPAHRSAAPATGGRLTVNDKIDICRGLFAFLVVAAHGLELTWALHPEVPGRLRGLTYSLLCYGTGTGAYWVMGFFVISGYCIYLSAQRLIDGGSFQLKTYLVARLTRIAPLYYIALVFTGIVEWWIAADRPMCWGNGLNAHVFIYQFLMIQNLTQTFGSYAPSWSITNEVFYYVFFGILTVAVARRSRWPAAIGMGIFLSIGATMQVLYRVGYKAAPILGTGLLFGLGINWFLGALVAEHRAWLLQSRGFNFLRKCWVPVLVVSIGMWCSQRVKLEFVYISSGIAFTLMLVQFLATDAARSGRETGLTGIPKSIVTLLGMASYPTYLFHGPMLILMGWTLLRWYEPVDWRLFWAISSGIAIGSGIALGYLLEQPIMAWRASLLRRLKSTDRSRARSRVDWPVWGVHQ